ncbi:MAG: polysaccharide deacetylase family protein [Armatimonadota bacterium]
MIGPVLLKRALKHTAGQASLAISRLARPGDPRLGAAQEACIFYYHRIAPLEFVDPGTDDRNVTPAIFERQIAGLAAEAEVVPLREVPPRCAGRRSSRKPLVSLTFDDGYVNFFSHALPILRRYQMPATLFLVTDAIGSSAPFSFDAWARKNRHRTPADAWRPMTWDEVEQCVASGLITIGAHSHRHLKGPECTREELVEEVERSREILTARFGEVNAYAYPYGSSRHGYVSDDYVAAVRGAGFEMAVTTDLDLARRDSDPYRLPRLEVFALDSPEMLRAKALGSFGPLRLTDRLRKAKRAV